MEDPTSVSLDEIEALAASRLRLVRRPKPNGPGAHAIYSGNHIPPPNLLEQYDPRRNALLDTYWSTPPTPQPPNALADFLKRGGR